MGKQSIIAPHGPFKITLEFSLTDGDQIAKANFDCPPGEIPTAGDIAKAAENVRRQVQEQLGDDFDWQTRHEFVQELLSDRVGARMDFAIPGPNKFEALWTRQPGACKKGLTRGYLRRSNPLTPLGIRVRTHLGGPTDA